MDIYTNIFSRQIRIGNDGPNCNKASQLNGRKKCPYRNNKKNNQQDYLADTFIFVFKLLYLLNLQKNKNCFQIVLHQCLNDILIKFSLLK